MELGSDSLGIVEEDNPSKLDKSSLGIYLTELSNEDPRHFGFNWHALS